MPWGQGTPHAWRKVRKVVLERDGHRCRLRYSGCLSEASEVHHVVSIAQRGLPRRVALDPDECVAACARCHRLETQEQARLARRAKRKRNDPRHPSEV